jgi:hypothetical protein
MPWPSREDAVDAAARQLRAERYAQWWQAYLQAHSDPRPPVLAGRTPCCNQRWVWSAEVRGRQKDETRSWRCLGCNRTRLVTQ